MVVWLKRLPVLSLALVAILATLAPAAGAVEPNQRFDAMMPFESGPPGPDDCASGRFVAEGVINDRGEARLCARNIFRPRGDATGTQHFDGSTGHYVLEWKTRCAPFDEQTETVTCTGQWKMLGAPEGRGEVTHILHFERNRRPYVEAHYVGVVGGG